MILLPLLMSRLSLSLTDHGDERTYATILFSFLFFLLPFLVFSLSMLVFSEFSLFSFKMLN